MIGINVSIFVLFICTVHKSVQKLYKNCPKIVHCTGLLVQVLNKKIYEKSKNKFGLCIISVYLCVTKQNYSQSKSKNHERFNSKTISTFLNHCSNCRNVSQQHFIITKNKNHEHPINNPFRQFTYH